MKDANQRLLLTVVLCMAVALVWSLVFQPKQQPQQRAPAPPGATQPATPAPSAAPSAPSASTPAKPSPEPRATPRPPTRTATLDSEKMRVVVTSDGAALQSVQLKGEKFQKRKRGTNEVSQVDLVEAQKGLPLPLATALRDGGGAELVPADASYELVRHDDRSAVFRAAAGGVTVVKTFTLDPRLYRLDLAVEVRSDAQLSGQLAVLSTGHGEAPSGGFFSGHTNTPARLICNAGNKLERLAVGDKHPVWDGPGPAAFAGIDEQYFIRAVVPPPGAAASCHLEAKSDGALLATLAVPVSVPAGGTAAIPLLVYGGPKDTDELGAVAPVLKDSVDLGFWSVIANVLLAVMKFFHRVVPPHNWGIAIILLTVTVKLLTFPLQHKSMKSMQEMQKLQPQIEELKKKYAGDQQRQNLEQMKLFKEHGVNPMGSCLPMVIQMPVWLALYTTLQVSVELYNSVFIRGWLDDLTAKDPYYILPVAMGITMVLTQVLTPTPMSNPQQKYMGYAMSVFFSLLMLNLPSGLTLYIFVNNILSILQQMWLRRAMRPPPASSQTLAVTPRRA
ncbi:MAG TPA: membrane protein insertase YidC [Myxococcales bacterium]|nr:membrane protein insertase YidC [Myxococcales bacterium]